jgi:hypothetical protein
METDILTCGICGQSLERVDVEYLVGNNHLVCELEV